ncbi:T9SS type A sorting domain-containing protein [Flavihumibacter sp. R14]|nr:T9SS type A sorting domain-containing protein [Flavihumibacter soli]
MKRIIQYSFSLAATVVFILGSGETRAQEKKEIKRTIIINDSDTIINGKKLSEASPAERKALLKEMDESKKSRKSVKGKKGDIEEKDVFIYRNGKEPHVLRWRTEDDGEGMNVRFKENGAHIFQFDGDSLIMSFDNDSVANRFHFKMDNLDSNMRTRVLSLDRNIRGMRGMRDMPRMMEGTHPRVFMEDTDMFDRIPSRRENSQSFNYVYTDKDGISSRMNIRVSEADDDVLKKINPGSDKTELTVNDLTLSPNFSNGKLNLSFNLSEKGSADIKIFDSSLKEIFTDKPTAINNIYFKQVSLPRNGVYYVRISQGNKSYVRRIVKE